jgi:hypothetical protein
VTRRAGRESAPQPSVQPRPTPAPSGVISFQRFISALPGHRNCHIVPPKKWQCPRRMGHAGNCPVARQVFAFPVRIARE